jgi:phage shock protein PspC (stress-responsive transcriptional regulator)
MTKRLFRSRTDKKIAGVCGGLANYLDIDPVIVRVIFVMLLLPGGLPGFLPYVILWIAVPEEPVHAT